MYIGNERHNPLEKAVRTGVFRIGMMLVPLICFNQLVLASVNHYTSLGNERVLLMNSDKRSDGSILYQGWNDRGTTRTYYWTHSSEEKVGNGLAGLKHTYKRRSGSLNLWQLENCRAGSGTYQSLSTYNYIPYSSTALVISSAYSATAKAASQDKDIGTVCMTPIEGACVYSPYLDGVGTIYFDAVNAMTAYAFDRIELQIATNVVDKTGLQLSANTTDYSNFVWENCPVTVCEVLNGTTVNTLTNGAETIPMNVTLGGAKKFYRVRATLNYRGAIRFRIIRHGGGVYDKGGGTYDELKDATSAYGWILVDNIMASYPVMKVFAGVDGTRVVREKANKSGTLDLGWSGFFSKAFLSRNLADVYATAKLSFESNGIPESIGTEYEVTPELYWRIRYLNQRVPSWRVTPMEAIGGDVIKTTSALPIDADGDLEYYISGTVDTPYFLGLDYAFDAGKKVGFGTVEPGGGVLFTEAFKDILEGRREPTVVRTEDGEVIEHLPSGGDDWFSRIREAETVYTRVKCDYEFMQSADNRKLISSNSVEAVLVSENTWRAYVPTAKEMADKVLSFRFTAFDPATTNNEVAGASSISYATNYWFGTSDFVSSTNMPYYGKTSDTDMGMLVAVDAKSGYLVIEVNELSGVLSITHGDYQNFNAWTDALGDEFVGNFTSTSGVARTKFDYDAWENYLNLLPLSVPRNVLWQEDFDSQMDSKGTHEPYIFDVPFNDMTTPAGWAAQYGMWVNGGYHSSTNKTKGMALQMEGRGKGNVALISLSPPQGVGEVHFNAHLSQVADPSDFAYFYDGMNFCNYTVAARATMSVYADGRGIDFTPAAAPTLSLLAYFTPNKGGYELRVTRWDTAVSVVEVYKWEYDKATDVFSAKVIPGTRKLLSSAGQLFASPISVTSAGRTRNRGAFYLTVYGVDSGKTRIKYGIGETFDDKNLTSYAWTVVDVEDTLGAPFTRGTYGIGSTGCIPSFSQLSVTPSETIPSVNNPDPKLSSLVSEDSNIENGSWNERRWSLTRTAETDPRYSWSFDLIPPIQSVSLSLSPWTESGSVAWEKPISSITLSHFGTTNVTFAPHTVDNYNLKLMAGGSSSDRQRIDVTIDSIEATQWRGEPSAAINNRGPVDDSWNDTNSWARTYTWLTAASDSSGAGGGGDEFAEIKGTYTRTTIGTGNATEYVYTFKTGTATFQPKVSVVLLQALVVGGGGGGGSVMGGGGGGGGVSMVSNSVPLFAGDKLTITVGEGGVGYKQTGGTQGAGAAGKESSLTYTIAGKTTGTTLATGKGGGGGAGWGANASTGGSGGGGSNTRAGANGTAGQGNKGGEPKASSSSYGLGGGGGGAGAAGGTGDTSGTIYRAGAGGDGIASMITGTEVWYGGGGGGGAGWKANSLGGEGGRGGGGRGANIKEGGDKKSPKSVAGTDGLGGGGGGGTWWDANSLLGNSGADGGAGTVILRVKAASRYCLFQPMRGEVVGSRVYPMSLRTPYLNGFSMVTIGWQNADTGAVLRVQFATNGVNSTTIRALTEDDPSMIDSWQDIDRFDFHGVIAFSNMTASLRANGSTNIYLGYRAPVRGILRVIADPNTISTARANAMTYPPDWGSVTLTGLNVWNEPELDKDCWWGWNLLTTDDVMKSYLHDDRGFVCGLNFSGKYIQSDTGTPDDTHFRDKESPIYEQEDPFIQAPTVEKGIGTVSFQARTWTNTQELAYVSLYGASDPLAPSEYWTRLAEIAVTSTVFETYTWKTNAVNNEYTSLRLTVRGAKDGLKAKADDASYPNAETEDKHRRVLLKNISVVQPVLPQIRLTGSYPFRGEYSSVTNLRNIASDRQQPILNEMFGFQTTVQPISLEKELDKDSIRVKVYWYAGDRPWGWRNWRSEPEAGVAKGEGWLSRCTDDPMTFRSTSEDPGSFVSPVRSTDGTYATVQYHFEVSYSSTSRDGGTTFSTHDLNASEWVRPAWYDPIDLNVTRGRNEAERFSAYTLLDVVPPHCAWVNEVNIWNGDYSGDTYSGIGEDNQYIELALPQGYDFDGWNLQLVCNNYWTPGSFAVLGGTGGDDQPINSMITSGATCTNGYAFLTLQSPKTSIMGGISTGGTTRVKADGTWLATMNASEAPGGVLGLRTAYMLQLKRPSGILEHQIVFASTNTARGRVTYYYDGTNICEQMRVVGGYDTAYFAGNDMGVGSLGVLKSHGEIGVYPAPEHTPETTTWGYSEKLTPGAINDGQKIDADQFVPPSGDQLWLYTSVGEHLRQYLDDGSVITATNGPAVLISLAKGAGATRAYSTNLVYQVDRWFEVDKVTFAKNGTTIVEDKSAEYAGKGRGTGAFKVEVNITTNDAAVKYGNRIYVKVTAKQDEQYLLDENGKPYIDPNDRYFPAVMDWLKKQPYGPILLAEYLYFGQHHCSLLSLKDMYFLDIPPTAPETGKPKGGTNDWALAGGIGYFAGAKGRACIEVVPAENGYTNVIFGVSLMITNTATGEAYAPKTLNGLVAGSTSSNNVSGWVGPSLKIKAALQNGKVNNVYTPLRWFTFTPDSFDENFSARVEIMDPFSPYSPAYAQGWDEYDDFDRKENIFWRWAIDEEIGIYAAEPLVTNAIWTITSP